MSPKPKFRWVRRVAPPARAPVPGEPSFVLSIDGDRLKEGEEIQWLTTPQLLRLRQVLIDGVASVWDTICNAPPEDVPAFTLRYMLKARQHNLHHVERLLREKRGCAELEEHAAVLGLPSPLPDYYYIVQRGEEEAARKTLELSRLMAFPPRLPDHVRVLPPSPIHFVGAQALLRSFGTMNRRLGLRGARAALYRSGPRVLATPLREGKRVERLRKGLDTMKAGPNEAPLVRAAVATFETLCEDAERVAELLGFQHGNIQSVVLALDHPDPDAESQGQGQGVHGDAPHPAVMRRLSHLLPERSSTLAGTMWTVGDGGRTGVFVVSTHGRHSLLCDPTALTAVSCMFHADVASGPSATVTTTFLV